MNAEVAWDDDRKMCVRLTLHQMASYQMVSDPFAALLVFTRSVPYTVDVMIVVGTNDMPVGFVRAVKYAEESVPPNVNRMVVVGGRQLTFHMIHQFMAQYRPSERLQRRFYFCKTDAEAWSLLDTTTDDLSANA